MDWISEFVTNWGAWAGVLAIVVLLFDRIAAITPTKTDDKIAAFIHKIATVIGLKFPDNPGKP